jgi:hypothetical protein
VRLKANRTGRRRGSREGGREGGRAAATTTYVPTSVLNDRKPSSRARSAKRMKKADSSEVEAAPPEVEGWVEGGVEGR